MEVAASLLFLSAFAAALWFVQPDTIDPATGEPYSQPTMLNADGTVTTDGVNPVDPEALARAQGAEPNRYAMARAMISEAGSLGTLGMAAVGWALQNQAHHLGMSVLKLCTRARYRDSGGNTVAVAGADGFFGKQSQHRFCSTAQDATDDALALADQVISQSLADPTSASATHWDSPDAFSSSTGASSFAAARQKEGLVAVEVSGLDPAQLTFWAPA